MEKPNLRFEQSFFAAEEIEGFYVESTMKNAWAAELEILFEIDRICKKHNIQYFADSGTLLGAVRHKGFIPWDDDIDLAMKRPDYQKFLGVLKDELPQGYQVFHPEIDNFMKNPHMRIMNSGEIRIDQEFMIKYHGCPYITGIDIFPLDYVPRDKEKELVQKQITDYLFVCGKVEDASLLDENQLKSIEDRLNVSLDRDGDLLQQIMCLLDRVISTYGEDESDELKAFGYNMDVKFRKEWFDEAIDMPFVNMIIPVPKEYDKILTTVYGDYKVPVKGGSAHDYPFYRNQQQALESMICEALQRMK